MEIVTPLGDDVLLFSKMTAREQLSQLFEYEVDLLSNRSDISLDEIMGKNVTVKLELPGGGTRFFNGYVTRFAQAGTKERYYMYHATVRPWLWFLTRRSNCRIFQDMSVPDIINEIFADHDAVADVKVELSETYGPWEYCVQYRESDFNFISRLMEQEGIYYYFRHEEERHTLVIADSYTAHSAAEGYEQIPFIPTGSSTRPKQEHIAAWKIEREIQPGRFVMDDYNFKAPSAELQTQTGIVRKHEFADYELYEYPGEYDAYGDGQRYTKTRLEEIQAQFELIEAGGNARGIAVGSLFKLTGHTRADQNREYLITKAAYTLEYSGYAGMQGGGANYGCNFSAMNSNQPFRALRTTRKPFVQGPQTAVVVGPAGDEIYTDEYGRVKVQFHWDREGKHDENASCWIRVSHPWAGKGWGAISIPRIGQEVIVDFLEGDPDQPIITGRVYNREQMPPWDLPANATQSGILSRSSKGAGVPNANAIRMEDKKGEEQLWFHAEKDQLTEVEHDETKWVGNDRKKTIDGHETTHVHKTRTETVDLFETITIGMAKVQTIGLGYQTTVGAGMNTTVGLMQAEQVGLSKTVNVGKTMSFTVGEKVEIICGNSKIVMTPEAIYLESKDIHIKAGNQVHVDAPDDVHLNSGGAQNAPVSEPDPAKFEFQIGPTSKVF
jgi:type VI secretion system secreted protein VgrG